MLALPYKKYIYRFDGDFIVAGSPLFLSSLNETRGANEALDGDTGNAVWDAAVFLVKYFEQNPRLVQNKTVCELGCGLGLCGIATALLGAFQVTLTDMDYVLGATSSNITRNGVVDVSRTSCLDWTRPEKSDIEWHKVDLLLSSDTLWLDHLIEPLVNTLRVACKANPAIQIIISNQRRSNAVWEKFLELVEPEFRIKVLLKDGNLEIFSLKKR
jgi:predicted nicotinamide N-methyase